MSLSSAAQSDLGPAGPAPVAPRAGDDGGLSLLALANVVLRRRRLLIAVAAVVLVMTMVLARLGRAWVASSEFMPQANESQSSRLSGLASQFGISTGMPATGESLNFYAELPVSRDILRAAVHTAFPVPGADSGVTRPLLEILDATGATPLEREKRAIQKLRSRVNSSPDLKANTITVKVTADAPELAERINRRLLDLVNEYNLERRQSRASNERRFAETRMQDAQREQRAAEDALTAFLSANRGFQDSPVLMAQHARLQRRVEHQQELVGSLRKSYEEARLDEVRDTPVITVVEQPERSATRSGTGLLMSGILGTVLGLLLGVAVAFMADLAARQPLADPEAYAEFVRLRPGGRRAP
ncbi:MAG TPA: hypothetical protein VFS40_02920 [Gemmatimonadales bacterium]|nr:hypothetical protein [Gemmatimonadales bacterium]